MVGGDGVGVVVYGMGNGCRMVSYVDCVCVVLVSGGWRELGEGCHVTLNENVSAPRSAPKSSAPSSCHPTIML